MPRICLASALFLLCFLPQAGRAAPAFADSGFVLETVARLPAYQPVGIAWAPDGAMFIWQDNGVVRVLKGDSLLPDPFIDLRPRVNTVNDRGLLGLALDPDFAANGYVYLLYTYEENGNPGDAKPKTGRLTRVTADPANRYRAVPGSETLLLGAIGQAPCRDHLAGSDCIGADSDSHGVGTLRFGMDRKLYVSIGDGASYHYVDTLALRSQDLNRYEGKILRINPDGSAPGDNPFDDGTQSIRSKVYAYGLRNPYRFGIDPASGELYIGDVGWGAYEEINRGRGANFGWPCFEGAAPHKGYQVKFDACRSLSRDSVTFGVQTYGRAVGNSVIGGTFNSADQYPKKYAGDFFFADFGKGTLFRMPFGADGKPLPPVVFMTSAQSPVSVERGPDGRLYYVSLSTGEVRRIGVFAGDPIAVASADTLSGSSPLRVAFSSAGSRDPRDLPITWRWDFGDGQSSDSANPVHTFAPKTTQTFSVKLIVTNSHGKTAVDTLSITVGSSPPRAAILAPAPGTAAKPGDTVRFSGSGEDDEETLPAEALSWSILLHHDGHVHPYTAGTGRSGAFVVEPHTDRSYSYEVQLTVTDRTGLQATRQVLLGVLLPKNAPPQVSAGADTACLLDSGITVTGTVSDDGLPVKPGFTLPVWSLRSGPPGGRAVFADTTASSTKVSFSMAGEYVLHLSATDGELESNAQVKVVVTSPPQPTAMGPEASAQLYRVGHIVLKSTDWYRLSLLDTRGRCVYRSQGPAERFASDAAEAVARRDVRRVYLMRVEAERLGKPAVWVLSPDFR